MLEENFCVICSKKYIMNASHRNQFDYCSGKCYQIDLNNIKNSNH